MITPQELQEKTFTKAVFGGYDMASVDDYLEEVSADLAALGKENAILKGKIKVLVEKVEEYRSTEDAMRMALLTAQKTRDEIIAEANEKKARINAEAENLAKEKIDQAREELQREEARLAAAKKETAKFVEAARLLCEGQVNFLDKLDELDLPDLHAPQPVAAPVQAEPAAEAQEPESDAVDDAAASIAENMRRMEADMPDEADVGRAAFAEEAAAQGDVPPEFAAVESEFAPRREAEQQQREEEESRTHLFHRLSKEEIWADDEPTSPRPKFNFDDLKFGSNYDNE